MKNVGTKLTLSVSHLCLPRTPFTW